jgi:hypothetical protein
MAFVHRLSQRKGDPRADSNHSGFLDAELHGDRIGGLEANAVQASTRANPNLALRLN